MSNYITRVTRLSVTKPGEPLFSELTTHVSIEDEAAGEYVTIQQQSGCPDVSPQKISVSDEEWPTLRGAVETLFDEIKKHETK